jgi:HD-like signal output (HDOD) protein
MADKKLASQTSPASKPAPRNDADEDRNLAAQVLALPGMKELTVPRLFADFYDKIAPKLMLGPTGWKILEAFVNIDVTAEKIGAALHANPYLEYQFFEVIGSRSKREIPVEKVESAVILLGMQNSRDLILALQLLRSIKGGHLEWTKEGKLQTQPKDILKYALKTEEYVAASRGDYGDTAYAAGIVFDVLAMIADVLIDDKKEKKDVQALIDRVYLAKKMPEFNYRKLAFATCLIHDVGKIALAILDRSYLKFLEECSKAQLPRALRHFAEQESFGTDHAVLGAEVCELFRVFRQVESAVLCHHEPFLLKSHSKSLFQLGSLIALSSNIATTPKKIEKLDDPVLAIWKGLELKDFKMDATLMKEASEAASR